FQENNMPRSDMPTIKELFIESWNTLKANFGSIFLLSLFGSIFGFIFMIIAFVAIAGISFIVALSTDVSKQLALNDQVKSLLTPAHLTQLGIGVLVVIFIGWVISAVVRLAITHSIGNSSDK